VKLWRICRKAFEALDGEGARLYGGRWNSEGIAVVYLSTTLALAALEYLVHVDVSMAPSDLVSVDVDVPDDVSQEQIGLEWLPSDWSASSDHPACADFGDDWVRRGESCLLFVPSAVIPASWNALLNPAHPDARRLTRVTEPFRFDRRLIE
jgi:RES domain-containing protein